MRKLITLVLVPAALGFFVMASLLILTGKAEASSSTGEGIGTASKVVTAGKAVRLEAPDKRVKKLRVAYAERDAHGKGEAMLVEFNNGSLWAFTQCKQEDSRNCSWNAKRAGNGVGKSFVDLRGKTYYVPKRFAKFF